MKLYQFLDIFFIVFHTSLILFNCFGWILKATRKANLVTLLLTGFSWFILGIFYGIGFCPFTEWHFRVLEKLGHYSLPNSYIKYLADRLTGLDFDSKLVDYITAACFFAALVISILLNMQTLKDRFKRGIMYIKKTFNRKFT